MDIETLAVDSNESLEGDIASTFSGNNTLSPENLGTKGFMLDSSDVLLFQKELQPKPSTEEVGLNLEAFLTKDKTLSSKDSLEPPLHAKDFHKILSKKDTVEEKNLCDFSSPKATLINKASNLLVNEKNISEEVGEDVLPLKNLSEISINENRTIPLESSIVIPHGVGTAAEQIQQSASIENAIHTHSKLISQQIKDQIIDRILVSANNLDQNKTVKIVLSPSLLESTEVNFQKIGQGLSIQFETMNTNSLQFLKTNQADLQLYLQENLKQFENISVRVKGGSGNLDQPHDGRSRNRYEYENLDDEEQ